MKLSLHIQEALANLKAGKLRSFLAVLGILVGTGSVVALVSGGQLATRQALSQFAQLGTDLLSVSLSSESADGGGGAVSSSTKQKFTLEDALALKLTVPGIKNLAPYTTGYETISYQGVKLPGSIIGSVGSLRDAIKIKMLMGRFVSVFDKYSSYCVIGYDLYQELKAQGVLDPLGQQIQVGSTIFTIIGVADKWPESSFFNQDINQSIIVPIQTSMSISTYTEIRDIIIQLQPNAPIDQLQPAITQFMQKNYPNHQLFFRSPKELIDSMKAQSQVLTLLLGLIGSVSLLVGGIGVMNIMLVSVVERKREIGIRMAVGARRRDIQLLFLVESITLTLFGGIMGVILGIITSFVIAWFARWDFTIFILPPLIGFVVSVAIGIFFGFYPAYQASRLDPIKTLRSD